ncbi:hypothetical protein CHH28_13085 [Bacterioplanes sanyensis]|uniref:Sensory/regulatory protein RpfC n=1 Tax=Bacterioplanes sanyensis TaxID=1249553 RepID=A0A222FLK5_9GAMM|nr:PAS domain-containing protein [Bacterioplanes sanyensis]ASP39552.1 hypothetical protein CHH28_13085 [Bacterioplanes sanyensis]
MSNSFGKEATSGTTLRRFILWRLLVIVLLPVVAISAISIWQADQQLSDKAKRQLIAKAEHKADVLQRWLNLRLNDARLYARAAQVDGDLAALKQHQAANRLSTEQLLNTPEWQRLQRSFAERTQVLTGTDRLFGNVLLLDTQGTVILSSEATELLGQNVMAAGRNAALQHAVEHVLDHGLDHMSDEWSREAQDAFHAWYVTELRSSDQLTGLVALHLDFSRLLTLLDSGETQQRNLIINAEGQPRSRVALFEYAGDPGPPVDALPEQARSRSWHQYYSLDGTAVAGVSQAIVAGEHTWYLLTETPMVQLAMASQQLIETGLMYALLVLLFSLAASVVLAQHMASPISQLARYSHQTSDTTTSANVSVQQDVVAPPPIGIAELDAVQTELFNTATLQRRHDELIRDSLLKSHQHLATLSDQKAALDQHCIIVYVDSEGIIRDANRHFCELTGYTPEELLNQPLAELTPAPFGSTAWQIERQLQQHKRWHGITHGRDRRHQSFWLQTTVIPLSRRQGTMYVCTDVTSQQRTQQTLNELHQITADVNQTLTQRINAMLELGCRIFELPIGIVSHIRDTTYTVQYAHAAEGQVKPGDTFALGDTYCSLTLSANGPKAYHHAGMSDIAEHPCYKTFQLEAYLGCPMRVQGQRYGTVNFSSPETRLRPFSEQDLELVQLISQWISNEIGRDLGREALQRNDRLLQQVSEQARMGGWEVDLLRGEVYWSPMTRRIHRVPDSFQPNLEEGINFYKPGRSRERIQEVVQLGIEQGTPWDEMLQIITYDGEEIWVQARGQAEFVDGQCVRLFGSFQDVNDQIIEQQRNALVLKSTAVGIWDWHIASGKTVFNERWAEIIGYSLAELEPTDINTWTSVVHPQDLQESERLLQQHFEEKTDIYVCEARIRHKEGHWVWILDTGQVVERGDNGEPLRMIGTHLDITERKQAEQHLEEVNTRLTLARDAVGMGIWDIDLTTGKLDWDSGMFALYGITEEQFHNSINDWIVCLHPTDKERASTEFKSSLERSQSFNSEFRIVSHPDGLRHIQANAHILRGADGQAIRVIGANYDITPLRQQQQQSERALSMIEASLEATDNGVLVTSNEGQILRWNQRFMEMWQLKISAEEMASLNHKQLLQHIVPQLRHTQWVDQQMQELYDNPDQGAFDLIECQDGRTFERSSLPMMLERRAIGRVWNYRDITSQQQNQQALIEARQQAEAALIAKSQFLASMSHEIRTPMNGVLGMLDLLQNTPLTEEQQHRINLARSSAQALLSLINDILDFSKIEAQKLSIAEERFDLVSMASDCVEGLAQLAQDKGLEVIINTAGVACREVLGDEGRSRQILTNLLGNAIKFTDQGEVEVTLSTSADNNGCHRIELAVRDTGIGIDPQAVATLFEAFSQVDASNTRRFGGTGLGLAIVRQLLQLMHGDIEVDSKPGHGSTFIAHWYVPEAWPREDSSTGSKRLLIISPQQRNNDSVLASLAHLGAEGQAADTIESAQQLLAQQRFDCILLEPEQALAENDNGEVAAWLLKQQHQCRQVLMTPMRFHTEPNALKQAGIDWWFPKPVTEQDLVRALDESASAHWNQRNEVFGQGNWQHLLLVEDNQVNQLVASELLAALGYRVSVANNGLEALEKLQGSVDDPIELVLMDCQMPELDGFDTTRRIRQGGAGAGYRQVPIVAMTANAMDGDKQACLDAGMDDYLSKPVNVAAIQQKLAQWLPSPFEHHPSQPAETASNDTQSNDTQPNDGNPSDIPPKDAHPSHTPPNDTRDSEAQPMDTPIWLKEEALQRLMGNEKLLQRLTQLFNDEQPARMDAIQQHIEQQDFDTLSATAHTLKGVAGNLGAPALQAVAAELEHAAREQQTSQLPELWPKLQHASDAFIAAINATDSPASEATSAKTELSEEHIQQLQNLQQQLELANYIDINAFPVLEAQFSDVETNTAVSQIRDAVLRLDSDSAQTKLTTLLATSPSTR